MSIPERAWRRVDVIDSHTGGEPTRVIIGGGPDIGSGPLSALRDKLAADHPALFNEILNEPRGSDILVGALLCQPHEPGCVAGVIFFNTAGPIGMCGHGTIGLAITLAYLGRIVPGSYRLDTPVGAVGFTWPGGAKVSVENVVSYLHLQNVEIDVEGYGCIIGSVVWGGNWFFLAEAPQHLALDVSQAALLTDFTWRIRRALVRQGITGASGAEIDHIELSGRPSKPSNHARNFVLCPGGAYDRSPCGTGTSAKLASLAAAGQLAPGEVWRQESVTGSVFEASYRWKDGCILPTITGSAFLTAEAALLFDPADSGAADTRGSPCVSS